MKSSEIATLKSLRFDGCFYGRLTPGQADALRRQTDAELRRDTVEAMLLEEIVIEEPLS